MSFVYPRGTKELSGNSFKRDRAFHIELECWFVQWEENRGTWRKTLRTGTRTNNKLNPHMTRRIMLLVGG